MDDCYRETKSPFRNSKKDLGIRLAGLGPRTQVSGKRQSDIEGNRINYFCSRRARWSLNGKKENSGTGEKGSMDVIIRGEREPDYAVQVSKVSILILLKAPRE